MKGRSEIDQFGPVGVIGRINPNRLYFPYQLVEEVGLCRRSIAFLKKKGCKFFGRKTKIVWINEFLEEQARELSPV